MNQPLTARCPSFNGPGGSNVLVVRNIGNTTTYGMPLVASVSVTHYQQGKLMGLCSGCDRRVFRDRLLSWSARLGPVALVLGAAAATSNAFLGIIGGVGLIAVYSGIF